MKLSKDTVKGDWAMARAWLREEISRDESNQT